MGSGFVDHRKELYAKLDRSIEKALTEAAEFVQGEAGDELQNSPARVRWGRLKNSISFRIVRDEKGDMCAIVGTDVKYAVYVHEGTGIYHPNGRRTKWRYKSEYDGKWYTTRGMKANRFLKNACRKNERQIKENIRDSIRADFQ